jgi:hypothetical protein
MKRFAGLLAFLACGVATTAALAHDPETGRAMPAAYLEKMIALRKAMASIEQKDGTKGIFQPIFQWPAAYSKLRICFFGASTEQRKAIAEIASEWESATTGISFDWGGENFRTCGKDEKAVSHIRIGFDEPGYFSALGIAGLYLTEWNKKTMNLSGYDKLSPAEIKAGGKAGTIRHEFGHALGLDHEHQSPRSVCEKDFNWERIYEEASKGPEPWTKEMVDNNFRVVLDPDAIATKYDPKSVMKYSFPAEWFVNGEQSKCFTGPPNDDISKFDRAILGYMYPPKVQAWADADKDRRSKMKAAISKAPASAAKILDPLVTGTVPE